MLFPKPEGGMASTSSPFSKLTIACFCLCFKATLLSLVAKKSKALWIARSIFALTILLVEGDKSSKWSEYWILCWLTECRPTRRQRPPADATKLCYSRGAGFRAGGFSALFPPPPLARFVNPQPGPDLAARIQNGHLITNSGFFDHPTACVQAKVHGLWLNSLPSYLAVFYFPTSKRNNRNKNNDWGKCFGLPHTMAGCCR